jgi:hypothetical protein
MFWPRYIPICRQRELPQAAKTGSGQIFHIATRTARLLSGLLTKIEILGTFNQNQVGT